MVSCSTFDVVMRFKNTPIALKKWSFVRAVRRVERLIIRHEMWADFYRRTLESMQAEHAREMSYRQNVRANPWPEILRELDLSSDSIKTLECVPCQRCDEKMVRLSPRHAYEWFRVCLSQSELQKALGKHYGKEPKVIVHRCRDK